MSVVWGKDKQDCEQRITAVLEHVWGDTVHGLNSQHRAFANPAELLRLLKITFTYVQVADDIPLSGEVIGRHHAQDARGHLLELLCGIEGRATYEALRELSRFHTGQFLKDRMLVLADRRAEADTEQPAWLAADVAKFGEETERDPRNQGELFRLALSRIDDLKLDLEDGDESEARVVARVKDEVELRLAIANRLRTLRGPATRRGLKRNLQTRNVQTYGCTVLRWKPSFPSRSRSRANGARLICGSAWRTS